MMSWAPLPAASRSLARMVSRFFALSAKAQSICTAAIFQGGMISLLRRARCQRACPGWHAGSVPYGSGCSSVGLEVILASMLTARLESERRFHDEQASARARVLRADDYRFTDEEYLT